MQTVEHTVVNGGSDWLRILIEQVMLMFGGVEVLVTCRPLLKNPVKGFEIQLARNHLESERRRLE